MKKNLFSVLLAGGISISSILLPVAVYAGSQSKVQLTIMPRLCVIDVVQDGSGQTVQSPLQECDAALPQLFAEPRPGAEGITARPNPLFAVPFAGSVPNAPNLARSTPDSYIEGTLTRIANVDAEETPVLKTSGNEPSAIFIGAILGLGTIIMGVDIAVFELRYSRKIITLARGVINTLFKR